MNMKLDIFEIALKDNLSIPLNSSEKDLLTRLDDDIKREIYELINNVAYLDEIESIADKIIKQSFNLSDEEQQYIKKKCEERVHNLRLSNFSQKSSDTIFCK